MLNSLYQQLPKKPRKPREPKRGSRAKNAAWYRRQVRLHLFDQWLNETEPDDDYTPYRDVVAAEQGS